jgi:hypothetical protein
MRNLPPPYGMSLLSSANVSARLAIAVRLYPRRYHPGRRTNILHHGAGADESDLRVTRF